MEKNQFTDGSVSIPVLSYLFLIFAAVFYDRGHTILNFYHYKYRSIIVKGPVQILIDKIDFLKIINL